MNPRERLQQLLTLTAFAVAQPLLDLLSRNAEFFIARSLNSSEIVFGVLALLIAPALMFWTAGVAGSAICRRLGQVVHLGIVALLFAVIALSLSTRLGGFDGPVAWSISAAASVTGAACFWKFRRFRQALSMMSFVPAIFGALFLTQGDVRALVFHDRPALPPPSATASTTPIVMVVFDELPLSSLLDQPNSIDPERYPGFADLAAHSTWFSRATTIADHTTNALPAIVTGRYPGLEHRLPIHSNHPENLFSWLEASYRVTSLESRTLLHLDASLDTSARDTSRSSVTGAMTDLTIIYLHFIFPESARTVLPSISRNWMGFTEETLDDREESEEAIRRKRSRRILSTGEVRVFRRFIESIAEASASVSASLEPTFYFLHTNLPHSPWRLVPPFERYDPARDIGMKSTYWMQDPWWSLDAYRRHLLQLAVTDALLGELLSVLRHSGIFDDCLLIVLADHGVSFWPGAALRSVIRHPHPEDLIGVPLFVKRPGQKHAEVVTRAVELIDIVPTIAAVIGEKVPWRVDGCSLLSQNCPPLTRRSVFIQEAGGKTNRRIEFPVEVVDTRATLERKLRNFESGLYAIGPYPDLVGRRIETFEIVTTSAGNILLDKAVRNTIARRPAAPPRRFVGELELRQPTRRPALAIAIGTRIAATAPALLDEKSVLRISTMLPPRESESDDAAVRVFLIDAGRDPPRLAPLELR